MTPLLDGLTRFAAKKVAGVTLAASLLLLLLPSLADAQTPDLFRPVTPADVSAAAGAARPKRGAAARERLLAVEPDTLKSLDTADRVKIALFPNAAATFRKTSVESVYGGATIWEGEAGETGSATLVIHDGRITGSVELRGKSYEISGAGGRAHRIVEIARGRLPPEGPIATPKRARLREEDPAPDRREPATGGERSTIRVHVGFTTSAAADPAGDAALIVALANKAYKKSGVRIRLELASYGTIEGYEEVDSAAGWSGMLDAATYPDEPDSEFFAATRQAREDGRADLVVLVRTGATYCGLGWYVDSPSPASADSAYSVVARDCVANQSATHEMGHNMGLDHDRYAVGGAPKKKYNFGFVLMSKRVRDIMAYDEKCQAKGFSCERLNRFSSPDEEVKGEPFGAPQGEKGAADAVRRLNETREAIAAYR